MTLPEWLYFLDTNSRVQCPEITCEQARELAQVLRVMDRTEKRHAREWSDLLGERDEWDSRMEAMEATVSRLKAGTGAVLLQADRLTRERDEAMAEVERLKEPITHCGVCGSLSHPTRHHAAPDFDADDYAKPGKR